MATGKACIARLEIPLESSASHQGIELFEFLNCLIPIASSARTGALGIALALVDPNRRLFGGWVSVGASQLARYSQGDKEAVTAAMRRFIQVGLAEEIQTPSLAEHLQREWRIKCPWEHRDAWVAAVEIALAGIPLDGRKNRTRNKRCPDSSSSQANAIDDKDTCGKPAPSLPITSLHSHPSSIPERREEGEMGSIASLLDHERVLLADALFPTYVQSMAWAQETARHAKNPRLIREQLPYLRLEATRNARAGKDGAGLLLHWIQTGQADSRAERCSRSPRPGSPGVTHAKPDVPIRRSLNHDPLAFQVWEPILSEVLPQVIPEESIQTWLAPLTAEAWDGEVLQLRTDSESAYLWITQQLEEELRSTGIAMRILPPETSPQAQGGD